MSVAGISIRLRILKASTRSEPTTSVVSVAGISIRLRILKGFVVQAVKHFLVCCRDIDPVEDTESGMRANGRSTRFRVAGISIRLRILKGVCKLVRTCERWSCRDIDPVEDTESRQRRKLSTDTLLLQGYRSG